LTPALTSAQSRIQGLQQKIQIDVSAGDDPHRCIVGRVDHRMLALARVDLLSGEEGPVFARLPVKGDWFDVSPDASTIVVTTEDDKLTVMTEKGSRSFTTTPSVSALQSPTFAPDGRSVLVSGIGFSDSVYAVGRFDLEGRGTPIVTTASDWLASPAVSGDAHEARRRCIWRRLRHVAVDRTQGLGRGASGRWSSGRGWGAGKLCVGF
jgi:hypothetical protein